ncbi:Sterol 3-beta-glucosyltransferase, partial [Ascosphaera atra]
AATVPGIVPDEEPTPDVLSRLTELFGHEDNERVITEVQAWYIRGLLLQGYMYITNKRVCFYAYLPKQSQAAARSGYLSKLRHDRIRYARYWFDLKHYVLSYYRDPTDLYFPSGHIDLRYGVSAKQRNDDSNSREFIVTTSERTYTFRADSANSAKGWVDTIREVIFRASNEGNSVKLSLPVENILDVEDNLVFNCAEAVRLRVIESEDTFAIDEYLFGFFARDRDAANLLKSVVTDGNKSRSLSERSRSGSLLAETIGRARGHIRSCSVTESRLRKGSMSAFQGNSLLFPRARAKSVSRGRSRQRADSKENAPKPRSMGPPVMHPTQTTRSRFGSLSPVQSVAGTAESSYMLDASEVSKQTSSHEHGETLGASSSEIIPVQVSTQENPADGQIQGSSYLTSEQEREAADADNNQLSGPPATSGPLHEFIRVGTYPLQRAAQIAGQLKSRGKRVSTMLATGSMGYYEKVSGMWNGPSEHYTEDHDASASDPEEVKQGPDHGARFREHFGLPDSEQLLATHYAYLHRTLPLYGKLYVSCTKVCFRSLLPGTKTMMVLPLKDIENIEQEKGFQFGFHGLVIIIRGHEELFFEFRSEQSRDDCAVMLLREIDALLLTGQSILSVEEGQTGAEDVKQELSGVTTPKGAFGDSLEGSGSSEASGYSQSVLFDDPRVSIINLKPPEPLRITCLTIGSRGDVQPYIALAKGLMAEGHHVKIATHAEFEPWIRKHGIGFSPIDGDPAELMRICVENGMFTYSFLKEASAKFRGWIDDLLTSAWKACRDDTDVLIESPSAMAGIHIGEALGIPYFRAFTMPWTRTRAYPHAFAVPEHKMGGAYNYMTYVMFDTFFWKAIAWQINRWRKKQLGLSSTSLEKMRQSEVPFLYNFSPSVVPRPLDFGDHVQVTGYWFLDETSNWTPPMELVSFMEKAKTDGKKIVYIGFGSIVVTDPFALTKTIADAIQKSDVRCILSKGWSGKLGHVPSREELDFKMPPEIYEVASVPHEWLFARVDAVAHHGGAGTTGASLRAGKPTIIKPFFGDQFFFGNRVEELGVGIQMKKLNMGLLSRSLWEATRNERMRHKAAKLGEQIRSESGTSNAIEALYRDLDYARTLSQQKARGKAKARATTSDDESPIDDWTIVSHANGKDQFNFSSSIPGLDTSQTEEDAYGAEMEAH